VPQGTIALDTSLVGGKTTGIGLYTENLVAALARRGLGDRLIALGGRVSRLPSGLLHLPARSDSRSAWMIGEVPEILSTRQISVFHGMANFLLPLRRPGRTRLVLTVHDLIPLNHPETVSRAFRLQFGAWMTHSLSLADRVICNSEATRATLIERFPHADAETIHLGADHVPSRSQLPRTDEIGKPYFLYVGAIDARKNLPALLAAFELWCARNGRDQAALVLAGAPTFGSAPVLAAVKGLRERGHDVRVLGHLSATRLWSVLAGAELLCCPSRHEGFSLPPLEALALGVPVVASDIDVHREVLGDAALLVPADSVEGFADAFAQVLSDRTETDRRRELGLKRAATFTWERCAEQTEVVYRSLSASP
jgi:glycosyltransferase involved in cell wall biosynthesis